MEEIIVLLLQGIIECGIELLAWLPFDLAVGGAPDRGGSWGVGVVLFLVIGAGMGALMNALTPHLLLPYPWLREANLVLAPFASGWLSWMLAKWRLKKNDRARPARSFWYAFCFTLGFVVVRFAWGVR
jgi:hypothetical protein